MPRFIPAWKAPIASVRPRNAAVATCSGFGAQAPTCPRMSAIRLRTTGGMSPQPTRRPVAQNDFEMASRRIV